MHKCRIFKTDRIDIIFHPVRKIAVKKHCKFLHMSAVPIKIGISCIDNTHKYLRNIDTSGLCRIQKIEHKGENNGNKYTSTKKNHCHHHIRIGKYSNEQISNQKENEQYHSHIFPNTVTLASGGQHIMGGLQEKQVPYYIGDHQH